MTDARTSKLLALFTRAVNQQKEDNKAGTDWWEDLNEKEREKFQSLADRFNVTQAWALNLDKNVTTETRAESNANNESALAKDFTFVLLLCRFPSMA
jgi:hypothetical protein